ncbi:MAG: ROK family protein [Rhodococcus sp. (in: high G+C Gram-positive bacteria)]
MASEARASPAAATSTQMLRHSNARILLDLFWQSLDNQVFTATQLIERSTLTRATVLVVCDDLIELGWVREDFPEVPERSKGRPARRFMLDHSAGFVVGVDVGYNRATAVVADLRGRPIARRTHIFGDADDPATRLHLLHNLVADALAAADVARHSVVAICFGIAAPVDLSGQSPVGNDLWESVRIDPGMILDDDHWAVIVENDANLAALAEQGQGEVDPDSSFVTLLAGERLGAGIVNNGALIRGYRGGAGELDFLRHVSGVGDADGIGALARRWAHAELNAGALSSLRLLDNSETDRPTAEDVFEASVLGDEMSTRVVDQLGQRLAVIISVLAGLVDPQTVVIAGAVAESCAPVIEATKRHAPRFSPHTPKLIASKLGADAVLVGAVHAALEHVRTNALNSAAPG